MTADDTTKYWPPGKNLPGDYRVIRQLGQGGMGTVYLVERHVSLAVHRYAVKTLIPEISRHPERRRNFLRELRTWIDLPEYRHLTACRFFRTIDDTLAIFAEYVDGCSLDRWILDHLNCPLEVLLDLAIQMARGLQCAHQCGVIHQDIKPSNVLISSSGEAKITDFGLARYRFAGAEQSPLTDSTNTYLISSKGMTMPYCSLEQAMGEKISRRTDIWSFGLTVLEMFNGGLGWRLGSAASQILAMYQINGPLRSMPAMPQGVIDILRKCFQEDPADRWSDMGEIAQCLIDEYQKYTGQEYPQEKPEFEVESTPVPGKSDRSTSLGGQWLDPVELYQKALQTTNNNTPINEEDLQISSHSSQRARALNDIEIFELAENVYKEFQNTPRYTDEYKYNLGELLFNKALAYEACQDYQHAGIVYSEACKTLEHLPSIYARELICRSRMNSSCCSYYCDDVQAAHDLVDQAIEGYRAIIIECPGNLRSRYLATCLMNKATMQNFAGETRLCLDNLNEALNVTETELAKHNAYDDWNMLGFIQTNLGMAYFSLNIFSQAMDAFSQAIDIFQMLIEEKNLYEAASCLGVNYMFKAKVLRRQYQLDKAEKILLRGVDFLNEQVKSEKREDLRANIAELEEELAEISLIQDRENDAVNRITSALHIMEQIVIQEDQKQHFGVLSRITLKQMVFMYSVGNKNESAQQAVNALGLWKQLTEQQTGANLETSLEDSMINFIAELEHYGKKQIAEEIKKVIQILVRKASKLKAD